MGSRLQFSYNIFTTLLKNKLDVVVAIIFNCEATWIILNNRFSKGVILTGLDQHHNSMDRLLEQNNREFVRITMMRHEEIFKQQVHELHRLYRVQKMLMAELRTKEANLHSLATAAMPKAITDTGNRHWSSTSTSETSHSSYIGNQPLCGSQLNYEYNSLHQYATTAENHPRRLKGFDLEQPAVEDITASQDRSKDLWVDDENDVELTLSIGCGSGKKKSKHRLRPEPTTSETRQLLLSNTPVRSERGEECSEREGLQRPPWLFQAMSLNRT